MGRWRKLRGNPSGRTIYFQDGFESGDSAVWTDHGGCANGSSHTVNTNNPHSGVYSLEIEYIMPVGAGGSRDVNCGVRIDLDPLTEVYFSGYVYFKYPELGPDSTEVQRKMIEVGDAAPGSAQWSYVLDCWTGAQGSPTPNALWLNQVRQTNGHGSPVDYELFSMSWDTWYNVEVHLIQNTVNGGTGNADGTAEVWVNGSNVYSNNALYINGDSTAQIIDYAYGRQLNEYVGQEMDEFRYWDDIKITDYQVS